MNTCTLMGNVGKDAEVRVLQNGSAVLKFSLATSERWKDKTTGEAKEKTEWHNCSYFSKGAEKLAQYIKKGSKLAVEGSIAYSSYEKDGVKKYSTDIKVSQIHFCEKKGDSTAQHSEEPEPAGDDDLSVPTGDDPSIPF